MVCPFFVRNGGILEDKVVAATGVETEMLGLDTRSVGVPEGSYVTFMGEGAKSRTTAEPRETVRPLGRT